MHSKRLEKITVSIAHHYCELFHSQEILAVPKTCISFIHIFPIFQISLRPHYQHVSLKLDLVNYTDFPAYSDTLGT